MPANSMPDTPTQERAQLCIRSCTLPIRKGTPTIEEITACEFNHHKIGRRITPVSRMIGRPAHTEVEWYRQGVLLGSVILDNIDNDWSFVALAKPANEYVAFDLGTSFPSIEAARAALEKALQAPPAEALRAAGR